MILHIQAGKGFFCPGLEYLLMFSADLREHKITVVNKLPLVRETFLQNGAFENILSLFVLETDQRRHSKPKFVRRTV